MFVFGPFPTSHHLLTEQIIRDRWDFFFFFMYFIMYSNLTPGLSGRVAALLASLHSNPDVRDFPL